MSDSLSIEQKQAKMVEAELTSGRWLSTMDQRGRTVYYNPTTKETTRDLRMFLLRQVGWDMLSSKHRDVKDSKLDTKSLQNNNKREHDILTLEEQTKRELGDAKALIEAYESEVTWLRLALLEAEKKLDPGELAVVETSSKFFLKEQPKHHFQRNSNSQNNNQRSADSSSSTGEKTEKEKAAASINEDQKQEIQILTAKLDESRKLNRKLLHRVSQDRSQKNLCSRCLQDVDMINSQMPNSASLAIPNSSSSVYNNQYSLTIPGGVGFPTTLSNPASHDAIMMSRGLHELHVADPSNAKGITHPAAVTAPVGYLPRNYDPMKLSMNGTTTGWESPSKRLMRNNNSSNPTTNYQMMIASSSSSGNNNGNFDPSSTSIAETPFHKNLQGLQLLRSSLEGDYPLDAHVRDPGRNDFFKSSYFTASMKGKTAGSQSTSLAQQQQQQQQSEYGGLNQSQTSHPNDSHYNNQSHQSQQQQKPRNFVNRPTPAMFYKSGTFNMSTI